MTNIKRQFSHRLTKMQTREPTSLDPSSIGEVFQQKHSLQKICKKADQIQHAKVILAQIVSIPLREHCFVANVENATLTLCADSASWATQLRYQQATILEAFQQQAMFHHVSMIKVRIHLPETTKPKQRRSISMSTSTSNGIKNSAQAIEHPVLKAALLRLSKNGEISK